MFILVAIFNLLFVIYAAIKFAKSGKNYLWVVLALLFTTLTITYRLTGIV
jgi:hypothetical protein